MSYFRCVHHLVLFFISFSSPTFIIYLSLYLILWLSLSPMYLSPPLSSATFTVTLQTCKSSSSLYLTHSLALISHPHPLYSLLFLMQPLCLSLSLSLFLHHVNSHFSNMSTVPLSLSHVLTFLSLQPCSPPFLSRSLSLSLCLQPCSPILLPSVVDATSLPFSHSHFLSSATHTHFTLFCWGYGLSLSIFSYVNRHSSETHNTPISLSLPPSLPPSLSLSLPLSLPLSLSLFCSLFSHAHPIYSLLL